MTKEQVLSLLKDSVTMLKTKGEEMKTNEPMFNAWKQQTEKVNKACEEMNSCDADWMNAEYGKWFKATFKDYIEKHNEMFSKD